MKKFEYKNDFTHQTLSVEDLNILGQEGWELVSIDRSSTTYGDRIVSVVAYYFKRELVNV